MRGSEPLRSTEPFSGVLIETEEGDSIKQETPVIANSDPEDVDIELSQLEVR